VLAPFAQNDPLLKLDGRDQQFERSDALELLLLCTQKKYENDKNIRPGR
jgi:hypothetical protein